MAKVSRYNDHKQKASYGKYGCITTFKTDMRGISENRFKQLHGDEIDLETTLDNILSPTTLKTLKVNASKQKLQQQSNSRNHSVPAQMRK